MFANWKTLEKNLGSQGSESGIIIIDEELPSLSRITIESVIKPKMKEKYFALTVGVYGRLVHTAFFSNLGDAKECLEAIKLLIQVMLNENAHL